MKPCFEVFQKALSHITIRRDEKTLTSLVYTTTILSLILMWFEYSKGEIKHSNPLSLVLVVTLIAIAIYLGIITLTRRTASKLLIVSQIAFGASIILWAFSVLYLYNGSVTNFSCRLSRLDALYFALGIFTTAGTGSLAPISELSRFLVACQYVVDIVFIIGIITLALARIADMFKSKAQNSMGHNPAGHGTSEPTDQGHS